MALDGRREAAQVPMLALLALALTASSAAGLSAVAAPARPTLYVYDHCPFCVRARLALGIKGVAYDVRFMANNDVDLPTALVGKKIAPIWDAGDGSAPSRPPRPRAVAEDAAPPSKTQVRGVARHRAQRGRGPGVRPDGRV